MRYAPLYSGLLFIMVSTIEGFRCSAKYIKFIEIKNDFFYALSKSDTRWDGKPEFFYMA